jgi:putative endonuclease
VASIGRSIRQGKQQTQKWPGIMPVFARVIFGLVQWASRRGFANVSASEGANAQRRSGRRTGIRGETFAYWYLRRHGYIIIARNFTVPGHKGEIDLVGYDGAVLAFIEVKTRTGERGTYGLPEDAVTADKRGHLSRMARQFLAGQRLRETAFRFDVVAIESPPGVTPVIRLHKGAFS